MKRISFLLAATAPKERSPLSRMLAEAANILPSQAILDNFVHHNPLHPFEHMHFHDAIVMVREKIK